ncbi:hypothetical protein C8R47DRAFT_1214714 [Mycena vitilis]|nr:hypothetical protein C8R47DRAFT_1230774 [Mycena vitilis]KAJ6491324.1 hypothetical protein C8R47DRAFT_1214714 [Mycena vitilis]
MDNIEVRDVPQGTATRLSCFTKWPNRAKAITVFPRRSTIVPRNQLVDGARLRLSSSRRRTVVVRADSRGHRHRRWSSSPLCSSSSLRAALSAQCSLVAAVVLLSPPHGRCHRCPPRRLSSRCSSSSLRAALSAQCSLALPPVALVAAACTSPTRCPRRLPCGAPLACSSSLPPLVFWAHSRGCRTVVCGAASSPALFRPPTVHRARPALSRARAARSVRHHPRLFQHLFVQHLALMSLTRRQRLAPFFAARAAAGPQPAFGTLAQLVNPYPGDAAGDAYFLRRDNRAIRRAYKKGYISRARYLAAAEVKIGHSKNLARRRRGYRRCEREWRLTWRYAIRTPTRMLIEALVHEENSTALRASVGCEAFSIEQWNGCAF